MNKKYLLWLFLAFCINGWGQPLTFSVNDVVILFDNDVHGAIEGYPKMAKIKDSISALCPNTITISCGDFLSGTPLGTYSKGGYIIRLMNAVGYDIITLGNHEFDYGIPQLMNRMRQLNATTICCNFLQTNNRNICRNGIQKKYGELKVAFIGVTTPHVPTTSTPQHFQDSSGNWLYTFAPNNLHEIIQHNIDGEKTMGADVVVLVSHVGSSDLPELISKISGIDVVLDGHSHDIIPHATLKDRDGKEVIWCSTGSHFKHIGQVVITPQGEINTTLINTNSIQATNHPTYDTLTKIKQEYDSIGNRHVGFSEYTLSRDPTNPNHADSPVGNFFADAYRIMAKAEIGVANGGGLRADLPEGELLFYHLHSITPFNNKLAVIRVSGQCLLDALEMGCHQWPQSRGAFLQVSGLRYQIDTTLEKSPTILDSNGILLKIEGARRICHAQVFDTSMHLWTDIVPQQYYSIAGSDYVLIKHGDGHNFYAAQIIQSDEMLDVQVLEEYLHKMLCDHIPAEYKHSIGRIYKTGAQSQ